MKELYVAPEAEIVRFVAEENLAEGFGLVSYVGFDVTDKKDGEWNSWESWFTT